MKKYIGLLIVFLGFMLGINQVYAAEDKNLVNIYLFHSDTCPHCREEIKLLDKLENEYDNITIYKYEISDKANLALMQEVAKMYDVSARGTPFTIIGDKYFYGFSYENALSKFKLAIDYYSENGYVDRVGEYIGDIPLPSYEVKEDVIDIDEYINEKSNPKIEIFGHTLELKMMTLPVIAIVIGLVDGFNPCAMWVLLFLISMLLGMKDRRRMWTLGITFLLTSGFIYLIFMFVWLNAATLLLTISWVRIVIGVIAIIGLIINIRSYLRHRKEAGCDVIDDKKRNKVINRIKKFTSEKNFFLAIIGVMALAVSVNIVELACSAGLPVMFTQILSMNNLNILEEVLYIVLYMLFFLLDDMIVFFVAMRTMELTGVSTKYGNISKLVGGILLLMIGLLMIFKPEWLMFNF